MAKLILKNHSNTRTIKIQVYASFCGILANSEVVEVGPNAVVETNFELTFGMSNTWWGASLRADVGGESDEWVNVDMVLGVATALYPNGDPLQDVGSDAQLATYGDEFDGPNWHTQNKPNFSVNNTLGYILFASWGSSLGAGAAGSDRWAGFEITNMPAYAEGTDTTYIYGRVTNMASNMQTDPKADYKLVIGTDKNDPSKGVAVPVHFDRTGDTVIFRFEVPRKNAEEKFYFFLLKEVLEDPTSSYGYGFVMHLTYNNIFNWTEE